MPDVQGVLGDRNRLRAERPRTWTFGKGVFGRRLLVGEVEVEYGTLHPIAHQQPLVRATATMAAMPPVPKIPLATMTAIRQRDVALTLASSLWVSARFLAMSPRMSSCCLLTSLRSVICSESPCVLVSIFLSSTRYAPDNAFVRAYVLATTAGRLFRSVCSNSISCSGTPSSTQTARISAPASSAA